VPNNRFKAESYQRQARSDQRVARFLNGERNVRLPNGDGRCHVAAMCQQSIEKSVKSLCIALKMTPARTHQIMDYVIALTQGPYIPRLRSQINRLFSSDVRVVIEELCNLVPKSNQEDPFQTSRNTEYPYLNRPGWIAPCDSEAFNNNEIARYLRVAGRIVDGVTRIQIIINIGES
jgi:hypothetical protein